MNYEQFLQKLNQANFRLIGSSYAFCDFDEWQIAFIRIGGKYQEKGKVHFIICARPIHFKGIEGKIISESKEPNDYPFKLNLSEINEILKYKFKLNFDLDELEKDVDWSFVYEKFAIKLPDLLKKFGVRELKNQIQCQKELNYSEKIWLEE